MEKDRKPSTNEFVQQREQMVRYLVGTQFISSLAVEKAFAKIPREYFVQEAHAMHAYEDTALPSLGGQVLTQPSMLARMIELLDVRPGMKVLEVGSGTGYAAALLGEMVGAKGNVWGVEADEKLVEFARANVKKCKLKNVKFECGDGAAGWKKEAPFDRILVSAACPFLPPELFKQLAEKGRVVVPIGDSFVQQLFVISKFKGKMIKREEVGSLYEFTPLHSKVFRLKP